MTDIKGTVVAFPRFDVPDSPSDEVLVHWPHVTSWRDVVRAGFPREDLPADVNAFRRANAANLFRQYRRLSRAKRVARRHGLGSVHGALFASTLEADGSIRPYGLVSLRVVTNNGVAFLVTCWTGSTELEVMKYHGMGTSTSVEDVANTALGSELAVTRATGSLAAGATPNILRTIGTLVNSTGSSQNVGEHGLFSASSGGTLFDRSRFTSPISVGNGASLQFTYDATFTAGG